MPPSRSPSESSGQPTHDNPQVSRQQDERLERKTAELRAHFEEKMTNRTAGHREVAVLILYWDTDHPEEKVLEVSDEVKRLYDTFKNTYGFNVYERKLTMAPGKAKDSISFHMADFMLKENFEDKLLIIYYAGHGGLAMGTSEGLKLTGAQSIRRADTGREIVWDKVETLIEDAKADMLLIFDCCHAAHAGSRKRRSPFSQRIYEVLAACQTDELTPGPGQDSFTSALIWALNQLAEPPRAFTTSQLYDKILNYPVYKSVEDVEDGYNTHHPYWSEKAGYHSSHRLKITPKSVQERHLAEPASQPAKFEMDIQLLSTEIPSIEDISKLCQKLKDVLHPDDPGSTFHQVLWRDFALAQVRKQHIQPYAEIMRLQLKQRRMQTRINQITQGNAGSPKMPMSPFSQDEILSSQALLDTQTLARQQSSSAGSLPTNAFHNGQLVALQTLVRNNLGWLIKGVGLILVGYLWGKSKKLSGR